MADRYGQEKYSPYAAMLNAPESRVDPLGLSSYYITDFAAIATILDGLITKYGGGAVLDRGFASPFSGISSFRDIGESLTSGSEGKGTFITNDLRVQLTVGGSYRNTSAYVDYESSDVDQASGFVTHESGLFKYKIGDKGASSANGISFKMVNLANVSSYESLEWIQSVATSLPDEGRLGAKPNEFYLDGNNRNPNPPFWNSKDGIDREVAKRNTYNYEGEYFSDAPSRPRSSGHHYWLGQLSLVGLKNGTYSEIYTIRYGYTFFYGELRAINPRLSIPEERQRSFIKSANNVKR